MPESSNVQVHSYHATREQNSLSAPAENILTSIFDAKQTTCQIGPHLGIHLAKSMQPKDLVTCLFGLLRGFDADRASARGNDVRHL